VNSPAAPRKPAVFDGWVGLTHHPSLAPSTGVHVEGKPLDARRLAALLRRYGVTPPHDLRLPTGVVKGYRTEGPAGLADAWDRYLPPPDLAATSATSATPQVRAVAAPET